jgi:hypothetical protein
MDEWFESLGRKLHIILSNAGDDTEEGSGDGDSTNQPARKALHGTPVDITDRILKRGDIGHNKFVVYVKEDKARAVLCGSTNWTSSGLCAQSNNSIVIESPPLADEYWGYWKELKKDTKEAGGETKELQGEALRAEDEKMNSVHALTDDTGQPSGTARAFFLRT